MCTLYIMNNVRRYMLKQYTVHKNTALRFVLIDISVKSNHMLINISGVYDPILPIPYHNCLVYP